MMTEKSADPADVNERTAQLLRDGYCIVREAVAADRVAALDADLAETFDRTPFCEGGFYGARTKRFGRLLARTRHAAELVQHAEILAIVERVLAPWCDTIQLNVTQAIAVHPDALPQLPHRDQDMWRAPPGAAEYLVNVMWPLTRFDGDNGATMVWPGSHGQRSALDEVDGEPVPATMRPGDALLFLGSTLHAAGGNRSTETRRGLVIGYSLGWLKPYENQWLSYPPEVARRFSPDLAALVGYRQHRPNLGNFEGQCPSILLRDHADEPLNAIDALRPDQAELVAAFVADQRLAS